MRHWQKPRHAHLDLAFCKAGTQHLQRLDQHAVEVEVVLVERQPPDLREVKQGVEQRIHPDGQSKQPFDTRGVLHLAGPGILQQAVRVLVDAAQRLLQVVAGHKGEGVELGIGARQFGICFTQLLGAHDDKIHHHAAQLLGRLDLHLAPRSRPPAHLLLPQIETAPRRQARPQRAHGDGLLVRVAGPVEGLNLLAAEPQDEQAVGMLGDGGHQNAAGGLRIPGRRRVCGPQCIGGIGLKPTGRQFDALAQPRRQRLQLLHIGHDAGSEPMVLLEERNTIGADAVQQIRRRGAGHRQQSVARRSRQHGEVHRVEMHAVLQMLAQLGLGDLQRCDLRQELGR